MNDYSYTIADQYSDALQAYVREGGEKGLRAAYEVGRYAIAGNLGGVDLMAIHQEAFLGLLKSARTVEESERLIHASWQFLIESLSPFEMTIRGYREALGALRKSEQRLRTLVETARDVIYSLAPDGTFKALNPAFEELTGYERSEWIGKPYAALLHPEDLPLALAIFHRVLGGEYPSAFEVRVRSKSGEYLIAEITTVPQLEDGLVVGTFGIARDVTDRRRSQEQLRSLAKRVVSAQEDERRRIARELHDDLCQWLSGVKLRLNIWEERLP